MPILILKYFVKYFNNSLTLLIASLIIFGCSPLDNKIEALEEVNEYKEFYTKPKRNKSKKSTTINNDKNLSTEKDKKPESAKNPPQILVPKLSRIIAVAPPPKIGGDKIISFSTTEQVPLKDALIELARVAKIDIDSAQSIASNYNVTSIPTLVLFQDGKEIRRLVGLRDANSIKHFIISE